MNIQELDRAALKEVLVEILKKDPTTYKEVWNAYWAKDHNQVLAKQFGLPEADFRLISEDFAKYDSVFKRLA